MIAEPFISPLALTIYHQLASTNPIQSNQRNPRQFPPEKATYHTSVILEVKVDTIRPTPGLALADNNSRHDLLPQFRLALLDGGHDHVADTGRGETVQTRSEALNRDDVQVARAGVVAAVQDCAAVWNLLV